MRHAGKAGDDAAGAKCARQRPSTVLGTALSEVEGRKFHFAECGIVGRMGGSQPGRGLSAPVCEGTEEQSFVR
jgi:hypothetical protein